jgi:hypothetical protein
VLSQTASGLRPMTFFRPLRAHARCRWRREALRASHRSTPKTTLHTEGVAEPLPRPTPAQLAGPPHTEAVHRGTRHANRRHGGTRDKHGEPRCWRVIPDPSPSPNHTIYPPGRVNGRRGGNVIQFDHLIRGGSGDVSRSRYGLTMEPARLQWAARVMRPAIDPLIAGPPKTDLSNETLHH